MDTESELVPITVLVPRDLVERCLETAPDGPVSVRHHAEARLLLTAIRIATTPPDPAEHLYELQAMEDARRQREAEREQYRQDACTLDAALLERMYPPARLCAMWLAGEREDRPGPIEPWERLPLSRIRAHVEGFNARRARGIAAAREALLAF